MRFVVWRCLTGRHLFCSIHFMMPGHTRFSPDQYFGLIKRKFRKTLVSSIVQLRDVVLNSTESGLNQVQLAYNPADGSRVACYDWKEFLSMYFQKIPNILKYHHFATSSEDPGTMSLKETPSSRATTFNMLKSNVEVSPDDMPNVIVPTGMSSDRQMYLFKQIRMFCEPEYADMTCPEPGNSVVPDRETEAPYPKRQRLCSYCRKSGHTRTVRGKPSCPKLLSET